MSARDYENDLALALAMADIADEITMDRFRAANLEVEAKPDMTPVTEADRAVERQLRAVLARERPEDGVVGEEYGSGGDTARRWIVDPIDGTKNYVRGIPVFATLIAVAQEDDAMVGVVSAPALGTRWWAARGSGAYRNGEAVRVSAVARLADAQLSYNDVESFRNRGYGPAVERLGAAVWRIRGFGDFWSHVLVADGSVDVAVEPVVEVWDLAALQVIVEEAGGRFTDLAGRRGFAGGSALATNGLLHDDVLALFAAGTVVAGEGED